MCLKKKVCTILYPRGHLHSTLLNHQCIALLIVFPMPLHNIPGNDGIDLDSRICKCGPLRVNNSIVYSSSAVRLCNKGRDAIRAKKLTGEISASGVATPRCVCNLRIHFHQFGGLIGRLCKHPLCPTVIAYLPNTIPWEPAYPEKKSINRRREWGLKGAWEEQLASGETLC